MAQRSGWWVMRQSVVCIVGFRLSGTTEPQSTPVQGTAPMFLSRLLTAAALLCSVVLLPAQSPVPVSPAISARVDALIAKMSVDDKLKLIGGVDGFYKQAIPSIAPKRLKMSDRPARVPNLWRGATHTPGVR